MKIIQIRGSNGAGKTTIVRQFVQRNNLEIKKVNIKGKETCISTNKNGSIVVLGRYDKKTGGCDLYDNTEHVLNTIMWTMINLKPKIIVFEGMIYSLSYKFASKVSDFVKKYNYQYIAISLYTNPDVVFERIYKRNGGKPIKENLILDKIKSVKTSHNKLVSNGYNSKLIDTTNINENEMYKVIEGELNEG